MRALRTPLTAPALVVAVVLLTMTGLMAQAQTVVDAETQAEKAARQSEAASGLVDAAIANRDEIEMSLAQSIARLNDFAAQLSELSTGLDRLKAQIGFADSELSSLQSDIETQVVDAYMTALANPGVAFVNSGSVEHAMVAGQVVEDVVQSGREQVDQLVLKRDSLQKLQDDYLAQQQQVAAVKAEVDAENANLARLYEQADAQVADAIRRADAADAAYRSALNAVEAAQAREAERRRQENRTPATPPSPGTTPPTDPPNTTTTSPPATTTTTTQPDGSGGTTVFPPAVERWRGLVQAYFPSARVDEALAIIRCESLGDPDAYNPYTGASGLFQFLPSTWASTSGNAGFPDASVFDPEANIGTAAWLANRYEDLGLDYWQAWSCRRVLG